MAKKQSRQQNNIKSDVMGALFLILVPVIAFSLTLLRTPMSVGTTVLCFLVFLALITVYVLFAKPALKKMLRSRIDTNKLQAFMFPLVLWSLIALYALLSGQFYVRSLLLALIYLVVPVFIALLAHGQTKALQALDIVIILLLWLPQELGYLNGISLPPGPGLPVLQLAGILILFYIYLVQRDLSDIGYTLKLRQKEWQLAVMVFLGLLPVLIALGMGLDFLSLSRRMPGLEILLAQFVMIFFFTAIPEELLFRGVIQNLIEKRISGKKSGIQALIITSIIFGLAHINNLRGPVVEIGTLSVPWAYVLMSTIAGFGYGYVWMKTRKVTASALTHLLINWTWVVVFNG